MADLLDRQDETDGPAFSPGDSCVEYMLFLVDDVSDNRKLHLSKLEDLRKEATSLAERLTANYIWQRDEFTLGLRHDHQLTYLYGAVEYGDSVEDEWLVVYILRELTLSRPNLWVRVFDGDGEFLLVEAANTVPPWINPEMDANRPWVHQGKLRIIPPGPGEETNRRGLSLQAATDFIRTRKDSLFQSDRLDSEAFYRLDKYPDHISRSLHRVLVTIPRKLAHILHTRPRSISPAVEAFYLRDRRSLNSITAKSSPLHFPPTDLVTMRVTFTRVLYAQLRSQRFDPPPRWAPLLNQEGDGKALSRLESGMKLTCGFEMMVGKLETYDSRVVREVGIILDDLEEDGDDAALPSDRDISHWLESTEDDDDSWLDINFEDFERELDGRASAETEAKGFGDIKTQADLRKLVARFESFLNDESAGVDGAEVDTMDREDDDDNTDDTAADSESSDDENVAVTLNEHSFARLMRGILDVPTTASEPSAVATTELVAEVANPSETREPLSANDAKELSELAAQLEAELREHGALKLDDAASVETKGKGAAVESTSWSHETDSVSEDGEMDIDYNLAKNILESFKSQVGMAGPAGNLLGMMGMQLPRDEVDSEDTPGPLSK